MAHTTHTADTADPPGEFLTVKEVAATLGCSPRNAYDLIYAGLLPYTDFAARPATTPRKGGRRAIRVRRADLDAFITARTQPAQP